MHQARNHNMTTITIHEASYTAEVLVEKLPNRPPQIAYVNYVRVPFEGEELDVILQVLSSNKLMKLLEARVLKAYEKLGQV